MSQALRRADGLSGQQLELFRRLPSEVDPGVCKYVFSDGERLLEVGLYPGGRRGVAHLCYLRLCKLNQVDDCPPGLTRSGRGEMQRFARLLRLASGGQHGPRLRIDLFSSRGLDVEVGCGQLCGRLRSET